MEIFNQFFQKFFKKKSSQEETASVIPNTPAATPPISVISNIPTITPLAVSSTESASPSAPTVFQPQLFSLATLLLDIPLTHDMGRQLKSLSYNTTITSEQIKPFTLDLDKLIHSYQSAFSQLKDIPEILTDYIHYCTQLALQPLPTEFPTHETFLDHIGLTALRQDAMLLITLQKLSPHLFDGTSEINLSEPLHLCTMLITQLNSLTLTVQNFYPIFEGLRNDILNFTSTVTQMQSNKMLAVNWNNQKASFMKAKQELEERRTTCMADEQALNTSLQEFYEHLLPAHRTFQNLLPHLLPLLENLRQNIPPDSKLLAQRAQLNQSIITLLSVYNELLPYLNTL